MANAEVGTAYVSIAPKMDKGFTSEITDNLETAGVTGGSLFGDGMLGSFAGMAGKIIAALGLAEVAIKIGEIGKQAVDAYASYEQLAGGAAQIFSGMDYDAIAADAQEAYKTMGLSVNEYLEAINQTGAAFKATMGDERGYETAKKGMQAISDYASGTGRDLNELNNKYALITRSAGSYQSIADQFAGILPATSKDFLEQAQAAGYLSDEYESLTEVPIDEYQQAVTDMLAQGVDALNLTGNTAREAGETVEGSTQAMGAAWSNWLTELGKSDADMETVSRQLGETAINVAKNTLTVIGNIIKNGVLNLPTVLSGLGQALLDAIGWDEFSANAMAKWEEMRANIDEKLLEIETAIATKWDGIKTAVSEKVDAIKLAISQAWDNVKTTATAKWEAIKAAISAKWAAIKAAVSAAITGVKTTVSTAWDNLSLSTQAKWDAIKNKIQVAWNVIKTNVSSSVDNIKSRVTSAWDNIRSAAIDRWNGIKDAISQRINAAKDAVSSAIDRIKGLFNFHITWPHIPLPHFSVSGSSNPLDWLTQGVPHISVDWYAKGGIFDSPSLIGIGERGPEAVLPLNDRTMGNIAGLIANKMQPAAAGVVVTGNTFIVRKESDIPAIGRAINTDAERRRRAKL